MTNSDLSLIMQRTNYLHQRMFQRKACQRAWFFYHFTQWLQNGVVRFTYWKDDDTIREARGTLNLQWLVPTAHWPKGAQEPKAKSQEARVNPSIVTYFDLEKQEWRSFRIERFIDCSERISLI